MSRIDIKNKLKAKLVSNNVVKKITGIEELGVDLYTKGIKGRERMQLADKAREYYNISNNDIITKNIDTDSVSAEANYRYMVLLIQMSVCDEAGQLIFENEQEAFEIVDNFPDNILNTIMEQLNDTNGIGDDSVKKATNELRANGELRFIFSLAKELGMTVEHLLDTMSSTELTHWFAFFILAKEDEDKSSRR